MAQLKDTVVSGSLRATDTIYSTTNQFQILKIPTSSNGTTYGVGSNGQVLKSNGTSVYWASDNNTTALTSMTGTLGVDHGGTGATTAESARTNLGIKSAALYNTIINNGYISWSSTENIVPLIKADGVMEIGKYIDFHTTSNSTVDYDVRIDATTSGLTISGTTNGTFNGNLTGNVTGNVSGTASNVTGTIAVDHGGTGSTTAAGARTNLGLNNVDNTSDAEKQIYEANLLWGGKNFSASYGPIDAAMVSELGANRLMFTKGEAVTIEYSRDGGSTWTDYGATNLQKTALFSNNGDFVIGKADSTNKATANGTNYQLRVTIDTGAANIYTALNKFVIYINTNGSYNCSVTIQKALQSSPDTFVNHNATEIPINGWSGYNVININELTTYGNTPASQYGRVRFIFKANGGNTNYVGLHIMKIMGFGGVGWNTPSTMAKTGHLYSFDASQNATFPAGITATSFSGNATTASQLKGYLESSPALTTPPATGSIRYSYHIASGTTGLFDNINNANGILTLNKFEGNYDSQLGFSANGNLYYRNFNNSALNTTTTWKQIAFTDSDITGNAASATKSGVSDIWLYPENSNEINFGGATSSTTIFIGYRAKDSRSIPTKYIMGGSTGTADLQVSKVYLGSGTSSYISSTTYTGTAANASAVPLTGVTGADDLKAIEALSGTSGFLKKTAANTWTLDTNTYLTSNTGVTSIEGKTGALTLADLGIVYSTDTPSSPTEGMIWLKPI